MWWRIWRSSWELGVTVTIDEVSRLARRIVSEVERAVVGKRETLEMVMVACMCPGGHVLLEDYPGLAKTLTARCFATALGMSFKRIQFTPDLLPGDITGGYVYDRNENRFVLRRGPVFANVILADEINRASPKTQSALLEAMQEYQVTIEGETQHLEEPFIVLATQNPIEYEGTFPLPEAQLDRFIMKLAVGYPDASDEREIIKRRRERGTESVPIEPVTDGAGVLAMRAAVETVHVEPDLEAYMVELIGRTRRFRQVGVGSSPRGTLALLKLSRARAALQGRPYVLPDDIKEVARPALAHRLILEPDLWSRRRAAEDIVDEIVRAVPVPVIASP
jgi:MoxR-like ATPase